MSICKHGIDFAEYTDCAQCDREEIDELHKENTKLREALERIAEIYHGALFAEAGIVAREALEEKTHEM